MVDAPKLNLVASATATVGSLAGAANEIIPPTRLTREQLNAIVRRTLGNTLSPDEATSLAQRIARNRIVSALPAEHLQNIIATAAHAKSKNSIGVPVDYKDVVKTIRTIEPKAGSAHPISPERMAELQKTIDANAAAEKARKSSGGKSWQRGLMDEADGLLHRAEEQRKSVEKATAGMGFIMSALFLIGAISNLQNAKKKDENGVERIQPTQITVGILMGALAVGTALVSHSTWKAAGAAR